MREYTVGPLASVEADANLTDLIFDHETKTPDHVALSRFVDGAWRPVTSAQFAAEVRELAAGLVASGVQTGERVALMSRTRYEWTLIESAIITAGAVLVPIYETSSAEQVAWILSDSGAKAVFVETEQHRNVVQQVLDGLTTKPIVWGIESGDLLRIVDSGRGMSPEAIEERRKLRKADDLVMIIYTSGTTGRPKGCMITHRNFLSYLNNAMPAGLDEVFDPEHSTLLFLPLAHSLAQVIQLGALARGVRLGHTPNMKELQPDLVAFRPHLVLSVPRVFEKLYNAAKHKAHAERKGAIFDRAERTAIRYSESLDTGGAGLLLRMEHGIFDRLVYRKIREAMGGRVAWSVSGGAPLGARLGHFYRGIGVTVLEGWGLTETTAGGTVNLPAQQRVGSVGRPLPGCTIRIAADGEILMQGEIVFPGYWNNDQATRETFTPDGWFMTGDVGELNDDGYLFITGRKKELIVTAAGKNVAPTVLEDRVRAHPLVSQCVVVGDERPYVAALVTVDAEAFAEWKADTGASATASVIDLRDDPRLVSEIQLAVDDANKAVSGAESIKRFRVLPDDFTEAGGQLTPTLKLKRAVIMKEHAQEVEDLYR